MEEKNKTMTPKQIREKIRKDTGIAIPLEDINGTIGTIYQNLISLRRRGRLRIMDKERLAKAVSTDIGYRTVRGSLDALEMQMEEKKSGVELDINKKALRNFVNFLVKFYDYDIGNLEEFLSKERYDDMEIPDLDMPEDYDEIEDVVYNEAAERLLEEENDKKLEGVESIAQNTEIVEEKPEIEVTDSNSEIELLKFDERKEEIKNILNKMGISCSDIDKMVKSLNFESKKVDFKKSIFEYIFSHEKEFSLSNFKQACEVVSDLSFEFGKYKDDFMILFLVGQDLDGTKDKTFRGNKEEDKFIEELLYKGVTIISIGNNIPPITNMQDFMKCVKENPKDIVISGMTYTDFDKIFANEMAEDQDFANAILGNISKNIMRNKYKSDKSIRNNEVSKFENTFGVKLFSFDRNDGNITRGDIEDALAKKAATVKIVNLKIAKKNLYLLKNPALKEILDNLIKEKEAILKNVTRKKVEPLSNSESVSADINEATLEEVAPETPAQEEPVVEQPMSEPLTPEEPKPEPPQKTLSFEEQLSSRFTELTAKIDATESEFVESVKKSRNASIGANLYAGLSQNGRKKNEELSKAVQTYRAHTKKINETQQALEQRIEELLRESDAISPDEDECVRQLRGEMKKLIYVFLAEYENTDKLKSIINYEASIKALKALERSTGRSYIARPGKRSEVADIEGR